jgi:hypothetical protein
VLLQELACACTPRSEPARLLPAEQLNAPGTYPRIVKPSFSSPAE